MSSLVNLKSKKVKEKLLCHYNATIFNQYINFIQECIH